MANKRVTVETEYITWENEDTHVLSQEMYPVLTYALDSATFKGNVPFQTGKIYVEIECNDLVDAAMAADPRLGVVSSVEIEPPVGVLAALEAKS